MLKHSQHSDHIMEALMNKIKSYHEMMQFPTFTERFEYLRLFGHVGEDTFGFNRYINQAFYTSRRWRSIRSEVIIRDGACNLAHPDYPLLSRVHIHHINPVSIDMFEQEDPLLFDMDNLVCVDEQTHRAIHYGDESLLPQDYKPRSPGDTKLW